MFFSSPEKKVRFCILLGEREKPGINIEKDAG